MPDHFVIIGAQRCGTTYLSRLLDEHPGIEMAKPFRPEPKFFLDDAKYARGMGFYESEYFSGPETQVRGEKSTSYIESDIAAQRIHASLPDAIVVVALRDPVQRAISNYRFTAQNGIEDLPMRDALRAAEGCDRRWDKTRFSVSPFDYLRRGCYADYLERFARYVTGEQIQVVLFEELVADERILAALYERLRVDPTFRPEHRGSVVNASEGADDAVDPDLERSLRAYFREPNRRLEALLERTLPWPA